MTAVEKRIKPTAGTLQWWMERVNEGWEYGPKVLETLEDAYQASAQRISRAMKNKRVVEIPNWYPSDARGLSNVLRAACVAAKITPPQTERLRLVMIQVYEGTDRFTGTVKEVKKWLSAGLEDASIILRTRYEMGVVLDLLPDGQEGRGTTLLTFCDL